jgi:hypothetical protein
VCAACRFEETGIDKLGRQHDLAVVHGSDFGTAHDEIARSLDVHDKMIVFDFANRADLFSSVLEEHVVAYAD